MATVKTFKDLRVYQLSLSLLNRIYPISYLIPHLKFRTQIINSSEAIPPLIAEGFAKKRNPVECSRFYEMAMGESDETVAHLTKAIILSRRFRKINSVECKKLIEEYTLLSKQLNRLSQIWRSYTKSDTR